MCQKSNGYRDTDPTVISTVAWGGSNSNYRWMSTEKTVRMQTIPMRMPRTEGRMWIPRPWSRLPDSQVGSVTGASYNNSIWNPSFEENNPSNLVHADNPKVDEALDGYKTVDVGKRRRPYFISTHYMNHATLNQQLQFFNPESTKIDDKLYVDLI